MRSNRVLVIGKTADEAAAGAARLQAGGQFEVTACDWQAASQMASSGQFQLVVVVIGNGVGIAAASAFARAADRWDCRSRLILAALTDAGTAALHRDLQQAGFDDIIHRPLHAVQIASRLQVLVRLSTMRRELARRQASARGFSNVESLYMAPAELLTISRRPHVLLVQFENAAPAAEHFSRAVRSCAEAQVCDDPEMAHTLLYRGGLDAVLICAGADETAAVRFVERMRSTPSLYNLPILLAVADPRTVNLERVFDVGVTEIAETSLASEELSVHLTSFKRLESLRSALATKYAAHVESTLRDGVTSMATFGFGMLHLDATLADAHDSGLPVSAAMIRIANIEAINREHGYRAGDMVLRRVGDIVRRCIRGEDLATRLSGASILIQFPDTSFHAARIATNRLLNVLRHQSYEVPEAGRTIAVTFDCNAAAWNGEVDAAGLVQALATEPIAAAA